MRESWLPSCERLSVYEGGYSNHPADKGGPTMKGVTQRVYDGYRKRKGLDPQHVGQLAYAEWQEIFFYQYWVPIKGDALPAGVDFAVFDGAISSGPYQSGLWLQRALGPYYQGEHDGHIGNGTLAAVMVHPDHDALIADMLGRRLGMLRNLKNWDDFGKGWSKRVSNVMAIAQAWAIGSVGPAPVAAHKHGGDAKAYASDVEQPPLDAQVGTQVAIGGGGGGTVIDQVRQQLEPMAYSSTLVQNILIGLTAVTIVIAVGGAIYAIWAARKAKRARAAIDGNVVADVYALEGASA